MVQVTRRSILSGQETTKDLNITLEQLEKWDRGELGLIQQAFPHLSDGDREFLMTGITEKEWNEFL
jgi:hypothetical protein